MLNLAPICSNQRGYDQRLHDEYFCVAPVPTTRYGHVVMTVLRSVRGGWPVRTFVTVAALSVLHLT